MPPNTLDHDGRTGVDVHFAHRWPWMLWTGVETKGSAAHAPGEKGKLTAVHVIRCRADKNPLARGTLKRSTPPIVIEIGRAVNAQLKGGQICGKGATVGAA